MAQGPNLCFSISDLVKVCPLNMEALSNLAHACTGPVRTNQKRTTSPAGNTCPSLLLPHPQLDKAQSSGSASITTASSADIGMAEMAVNAAFRDALDDTLAGGLGHVLACVLAC